MDRESCIHSGYLTNLRTNKCSFFTLHRNGVILYFKSHTNVKVYKGHFLISTDTIVTNTSSGFNIKTSTDEMQFECDSNERCEWFRTIKLVTAKISSRYLDGYAAYKTSTSSSTTACNDSEDASVFFILDNNTLRCYHNQSSAVATPSNPIGIHVITHTCRMRHIDDVNLQICISCDTDIYIRFGDKQRMFDYLIMKERIIELVETSIWNFHRSDVFLHRSLKTDALIDGKIHLYACDDWKACYIILTNSNMIVYNSNERPHILHAHDVIDVATFDRNAIMCETNLHEYSFVVSTGSCIYHFACHSQAEKDVWMLCIATITNETTVAPINESMLLPLNYNAADSDANTDVLYNITFHKHQQAKVVFEKCNERVVVKDTVVIHNKTESTVYAGSVVHKINDECVVTSSMKYSDIIDQLVHTPPPLTVTFKRSPHKSGILRKQSSNSSTWKHKHFELLDGKLLIKDISATNVGCSKPNRGCIPMFAAAITLLPSSTTGRLYCFQVCYGLEAFVLQASTLLEMREWVAAIYQAINITSKQSAVGGSMIKAVASHKDGQESIPVYATEQVSDTSSLQLCANKENTPTTPMAACCFSPNTEIRMLYSPLPTCSKLVLTPASKTISSTVKSPLASLQSTSKVYGDCCATATTPSSIPSSIHKDPVDISPVVNETLLRRIFHRYSQAESMSVFKFSSMYRDLTDSGGNLYSEMTAFQKFSSSSNSSSNSDSSTSINVETFVDGCSRSDSHMTLSHRRVRQLLQDL